MYLVDTNIFLEILLGQKNSQPCKDFLYENTGKLNMTDFSLHSIGVILFRYEKEDVFAIFAEDILPSVTLHTLPLDGYSQIAAVKQEYGMDFDDCYQCVVAKTQGLTVVTMDADFKKAKNTSVLFI